MRFMVMIKATRDYESGLPPSPELMSGMAKLTEEYVKSGARVAETEIEIRPLFHSAHFDTTR